MSGKAALDILQAGPVPDQEKDGLGAVLYGPANGPGQKIQVLFRGQASDMANDLRVRIKAEFPADRLFPAGGEELEINAGGDNPDLGPDASFTQDPGNAPAGGDHGRAHIGVLG
jgi:hypothetical protein